MNGPGRLAMICPQCKASGLRSTVHIGGSVTTLMGGSEYYDADGRYRRHDPNTTTTRFSCSNGHNWSGRAVKAGERPE